MSLQRSIRRNIVREKAGSNKKLSSMWIKLQFKQLYDTVKGFEKKSKMKKLFKIFGNLQTRKSKERFYRKMRLEIV